MVHRNPPNATERHKRHRTPQNATTKQDTTDGRYKAPQNKLHTKTNMTR